MRQISDAIVCLALAVVLFRTFSLEGYMISTGSMAPSLLGYHKQITCPACAHQYAFGTHFDESVARSSEATATPDRAPWAEAPTTCPNCGQTAIETATVPGNQGDQLLVHKNAYLLRNPRRWEVIVFRSPSIPTQAYVKRLVGLPNETVEIRGGDLYIDGMIARKPLEAQRAVRILVHAQKDAPPPAIDWQPRWMEFPPQEGGPGWTAKDHGFRFDGAVAPDSAPAWTAYRHWLRTGGRHQTRVSLKKIPGQEFYRAIDDSPVSYDRKARKLAAVGSVSSELRERLLQVSSEPEYVAAIEQLYEDSHAAPITDAYGYNEPEYGRPMPVRDVMFSATLHVEGGNGHFCARMTDGQESFDCVLDVGAREIRLCRSNQTTPLRVARLSDDFARAPLEFEMSLFDRQVAVALNGEQAFSALELLSLDANAPATRNAVRFGAKGLTMEVRDLQLFRDVYYTDKGNGRPFQLEADEYYVLGDNSPLSYDSRSWPDGAVPAHLLVGKPFVVHLPSRPGHIDLWGRTISVRIPDFSRIRYIR